MGDKDTYAENIGNAVAEYSLETQSEQALRHYEGISRAVMHWSSFIERAIIEYPKLKALEAERNKYKSALEKISKYGEDGICPYGCDTPNIATKALTMEATNDAD